MVPSRDGKRQKLTCSGWTIAATLLPALALVKVFRGWPRTPTVPEGSAERQRLGTEGHRVGARGGHPPAVVHPAQHLVGHLRRGLVAACLLDIADDDHLPLDDH